MARLSGSKLCFKMLVKCLTLLCLVKIIFVSGQSNNTYSYYYKSDLTFVIDDTGSMSDDIDQVKIGVDAIFDTVLTHAKSQIENFTIVTFNDYHPYSFDINTDLSDTKLRTRTKDRDEFKNALKSIDVDGGADCPEYSLSGIKRGIEASLPGSVIYVYTDAPSKDYKLYESVKSLALSKQCQVNFVVTDGCGWDPDDEPTKVYYDLAEITNGQVFKLGKSEIGQVLEYVKDTITERKYTLIKEELPPGKNNVTIPVDPTTTNVTVAVSGKSTVSKVDLHSPCGSKPPIRTISKTDKIRIINFDTVCAGDYIIYIESDDKTSLIATGTSSVLLKHGFSTIKPTSLEETSSKPVPDVKSYVSIAVLEGDIQLLAIKIRDIDKKLMPFTANDDSVVLETPLVKFHEKFYLTEPILPPKSTFHLAIICYDPKSKTNFTRLTQPIEYQKVIPEDIKNVPSSVVIEGDTSINVKFEDNLKIICKVKGYPKPDIVWQNVDNGVILPSEVSIYELPNDYTSILILDNVKENGTYECSAINAHGSDAKRVSVLTTAPSPYFNVAGSLLDRTYVEYDKKGEIHCEVNSYPPAKITWMRNDKPIKPSDNIKISNFINKSTLTIEQARISDKGTYVCIAKNDFFPQARITKLVVITGIDPATITTKGKDFVKIKVGDKLKIDCNVKGIPTPRVTWFKDDFTLSDSLDSVQFIKEDVQLSDSGSYICKARNEIGVDYRKVLVEVILPAYIIPPRNTNIEVIVWDTVTLPCKATGYPEPKVEWIYRGGADSREVRIAKGEPLYLKHIQMKQEGQYICVASNGEGFTNITYDIHVFAPPIIENRYLTNELTAVEGDVALRITCKASGNPKPDITWSKDGLNLALGTYYSRDGDDFIIMDITEKSKGIYMCEAKNRFGTDSEIYKVSVKKYVLPKTPTSHVHIKSGIRTEIPCTVNNTLVDLVRWYRNGVLIRTGRLVLENPKVSDSGVYTCRVSNMFSSKSGDVEVIVGEEPAFSTHEDLTVDLNENEEGTNYELYCGATGVPEPSITWYHDHEILDTVGPIHVIKLTVANIGKYSCIVKNYFGQISRTFDIVSSDCFINTENLPEQPLLVSSRLTWPDYKTFNKQIVIPKDDNFLLYCPSQFKKFPTTYLLAFCGANKKIVVNGNEYDYSNLQCKKEVWHKVRKTGEKCLPGNTEKVKIEYELDFESSEAMATTEVYEVCFNKTTNMPIYAVHDMGTSVASVDIKTTWSDQDLFYVDFDDAYSCKRQTNGISASLGRNFHRDGDCCFSRRQLVNPRDVFMGVPQTSTYSFFNVVPHWSTCHMENWNELEQKVRSFAKDAFYNSIKVWTGISGQLSLPNGMNHFQRIYIKDRGGVSQPVPMYLWKVVQDPWTRSSLAVIQLNVPDLSPADVAKYVPCNDICHETDWMKGAQWKDVNRGYTFCCSLRDFENAFGYRNVFKPMYTVLQINDYGTPSIDSLILT